MASNCDCHTGGCEIDLTGIGQVGATGEQGGYGGWSSLWDFSTTTTTGTTDGQLRLNNATYASVTGVYANITNADSTDVTAFLNSLANSSYFGKVKIFKKTDSTVFWEGTITGHSISGSECRLTVTYVLHNGAFAAADEVVLTFTPAGIGGKPLIFSDNSSSTSNTTGSWVTPAGFSFTIPAGTLATNGDYLEVIYCGQYGVSSALTDISGVRAILNGADAITGYAPYDITGGGEIYHYINTSYGSEFEIKLRIIRVNATSVITMISAQALMETPIICAANGGVAITVNDLAASTNTIAPQIYQSSAMQIVIYDIKITKYLQ